MRSCLDVMPLAVAVTAIAFTEWVKKYDWDFTITSGQEYEEMGDVKLCLPNISFQTSLLSCEKQFISFPSDLSQIQGCINVKS